MLERMIIESIIEILTSKHKMYFEDSRACSVQYERTEDGITRVGHLVMQTPDAAGSGSDYHIAVATSCFAEGDTTYYDKSHVCVRKQSIADPNFSPDETAMVIADWVQHGINRLNNKVL